MDIGRAGPAVLEVEGFGEVAGGKCARGGIAVFEDSNGADHW